MHYYYKLMAYSYNGDKSYYELTKDEFINILSMYNGKSKTWLKIDPINHKEWIELSYLSNQHKIKYGKIADQFIVLKGKSV